MVKNPRPSRRSSSRRRSRRRAVLAIAVVGAVLAAAFVRPASPQEPPRTIVITEGASRLAIPDCVPRSADEASQTACRTMTQVLRNDLRFEGLFQFVPENLFSAIPPQNADAPNFEDWKGIGATVLVATRAVVANGELTLEAHVYDVAGGTTMLARRYTGKAENPRYFAHQASDDIVALTNYKGVAKTRIAFVSDRDATKERRSKEIYIADYDGFNARRVTVNGSLNITPTWTPDGKGIAYVSYRQGSPLIYLARIFEGRSVPNLSGERGSQAFAPAFSPDGTKLAFASDRSGNTDIWVSSADGGGARRLTTTQASDTAPCWSRTGQEIGFTSNRTGTPQIWVMDSDGLNVRRLTTVGNYNDGCAWNPSAQYPEVAYTARLEGGPLHFDIAVIDLATRQVRQITEGRGSCEYPSWAPNGRHLVFSCNRGGRWEITVSDREGRSLQTLATGPGSNVQPDWGP